jgi:hypothetical protein
MSIKKFRDLLIKRLASISHEEFILVLKTKKKLLKIDELVKSLILCALQAILGFMIRLAKLQELGLTPSNSLQFLTPGS